MKRPPGAASERFIVGIEAGATRTVALAVGPNDQRPLRVEAGPANLILLTDAQLLRLFRTLAASLPRPAAMAIGMAGARTQADRQRIRALAAQVWPGVPCYATDDLETGLMAAQDSSASPRRAAAGQTAGVLPRVLVLSGTGSCCFGRRADGSTVRVGGWGHILGDKGSGYDIGLRGLQAVIQKADAVGRWPALGRRLLRALALNEPEDLVSWAQGAGKHEMAALAVEVFRAWQAGDALAAGLVEAAACTLADYAVACARRLSGAGAPVQFVLAGSVLLKQPGFARRLRRELRRRWPKAIVTPLKRESVWGAVELARQLAAAPVAAAGVRKAAAEDRTPEAGGRAPEAPPLQALELSPTEQRNPRSMHLDKLPLRAAITLMLEEDKRIVPALLAQRGPIEQALRRIVRSFRQGGRLFYVGAGTSGRLGVLDASECPPTFSVPPERVQGIIAGGQRALWESVEGAEDNAAAGAQALQFRGVGRRDTVVGIAASGRTPFVWGALREARRRHAATVLLCFNPKVVVPPDARPEVLIVPEVGPEILTGSTRLKAGTATKQVLNLLSTLAMVRLGKVVSNLMVDVKPSNAKLRERAVRIVRALSGAGSEAARAALERTGWRIKLACARLRRAKAAGVKRPRGASRKAKARF